MRYFLLFILFLMGRGISAQTENAFTSSIQKFYAQDNDAAAEQYWMTFKKEHPIPFVYDDSVAFFYQGKVKSIRWTGDFDGWGYDKSYNSRGRQIPHTDVWIWKTSFPKDARLDYKIVADENNWMLDPLNSNRQWSGVGGGSPNSELRMPDWKVDPITVTIADAPEGKVETDILVDSKVLNYQLSYSVYVPPEYDASRTYPTIYVMDGYEYMHPRMGNMITILNNLIHLKKIKPIIAVFIDHREPVDRSNNRRMQELAMNEKYLSFLKDELIPQVEKQYAVSRNPDERAVLGRSVGGLAAAYFAFSKPPVFGMAGIQSPAFWFQSSIYTFCDNPEHPPVKTFLTTGIVHDAEDGARKMKDVLEKNTCNYQYREVDQGPSWGNWRDLIDDILIYFFPAK